MRAGMSLNLAQATVRSTTLKEAPLIERAQHKASLLKIERYGAQQVYIHLFEKLIPFFNMWTPLSRRSSHALRRAVDVFLNTCFLSFVNLSC